MFKKIKITFFLFPLIFAIVFLAFSKKEKVDAAYCAFCDPSVLDAQKFYEDDWAIALYTHKPIFPGHCLIIPKRHVQRFEELSEEEASHIFQTVKKVDVAVQDLFHTSSYLLLQKNGREVGQTVPHVHFHYIPRPTGDTSTLKFILKMYIADLKQPISAQDMKQIVTTLKSMNFL